MPSPASRELACYSWTGDGLEPAHHLAELKSCLVPVTSPTTRRSIYAAATFGTRRGNSLPWFWSSTNLRKAGTRWPESFAAQILRGSFNASSIFSH